MRTKFLCTGLFWALTLGPALAQTAPPLYRATTTTDTRAVTVVNLAPYQEAVDDPPASTLIGAGVPLLNSQSAHAQLLGPVLNGVGDGSAWVSVAPGGVQLQVSVGGSTNIDPGAGTTRALLYGAGSASAQGSFSDTVVWQASGLAAGSLLYLDLLLSFEGVAGVGVNNVFGWSEGSVGYSWQATMGAWGGGASGYRAYTVSNGTVVRDDTQFGSFAFTVPVYVGVPVDLTMSASVDAWANGNAQCDNCSWVNNGAAAASGDFGQGLSWAGVSGARTASGAALALADVSVLSASGFNYAAPVPEPAAVVLLVAGLVALRWRRRH